MGPNRFSNVMGAADGIDIKILAPYEDKISYYNRKGQYSIKFQAICEGQKLFTSVFFGFPGACHDTIMWKSSAIFKLLNNAKTGLPNDYHIQGGSPYPLNAFLMKPFRDNGHLPRKQIHFNKVLSSQE